jgi:anaerobic selenocysteine-containing dehydrogenase
MNDYEKKIHAKIPCEETGISIKHTICSICEPSSHCGVDVYIKDGEIIKVEGTDGFPVNNGKLCTKGQCNRQYIYRKDRIKSPLRRTGPRGSGSFEKISWEKAYSEIGEKLLKIKSEYGAHAVSFYSGYSKWYRTFLKRLAYSFGSPNFGTESSSCAKSVEMAWKIMTGSQSSYDFNNAKVLLAWAMNPFYSKPMQLKKLYEAKERGLKIIVIDPQITPMASNLADLHLQIKPGTDGALALGMAKLIIDNDWLDWDYINNHVHGFKEYSEYVKQFDLEKVCDITGLKAEDIYKATEWYATSKPSCISQSSAPIVHHRNGMQSFRAIMSLTAITGNYDVKGGNFPVGRTFAQMWAGFSTREDEFMSAKKPKNGIPRIGALRFPLWNELIDEDQMMDLARHINEADPYPLKALVAFGMNHRMFPSPAKLLEAIDKLELVVCTDLFMTDSCKHSDYVLPVCSSFERSEFKTYPGGYAYYTQPAIQPLYGSKSDVTVIKELADSLNLDDPLLRSGYEECVRWIISDCDFDLDLCKKSESPVKVPDFKPFVAGEYTKRGYDTPTGKFELYSTILEKYKDKGYDPLPVYQPALDPKDTEESPFILTSGSRLANAIHTRLHKVPWARSLRPYPTADINIEDAKRLGISEGDTIEISNNNGSIIVWANPTNIVLPGVVQMYHGYEEADMNELFPPDHLDPYSGFPAYNSVQCKITKLEVV